MQHNNDSTEHFGALFPEYRSTFKPGLGIGDEVLYNGEKRIVSGFKDYHGVYVRKPNEIASQLVPLFKGRLTKLIFD